MGIPIGKLSLYCAAGGIAPHRVLPVTIDVGTDNQDLLNDEFYLGLKIRRMEGDVSFCPVVSTSLRCVPIPFVKLRRSPLLLRSLAQDYFAIVDEFMQAVKHRWPRALIQFEDFRFVSKGSLRDPSQPTFFSLLTRQ